MNFYLELLQSWLIIPGNNCKLRAISEKILEGKGVGLLTLQFFLYV
jgi:hypothetical protein